MTPAAIMKNNGNSSKNSTSRPIYCCDVCAMTRAPEVRTTPASTLTRFMKAS
jgi:hypothetical protein